MAMDLEVVDAFKAAGVPAETKVELIRWFLGSLVAVGGVVAAIFRMTAR